jgi:hypothetical protein
VAELGSAAVPVRPLVSLTTKPSSPKYPLAKHIIPPIELSQTLGDGWASENKEKDEKKEVGKRVRDLEKS